jgi:hypothetical protein
MRVEWLKHSATLIGNYLNQQYAMHQLRQKEYSMKRSFLCIVFCFILLFSTTLTAADSLKLLKIEIPQSGKKIKQKLQINMEQLSAIITGMNLKEDSAVIELVDQDSRILAPLGEFKKGSLNWKNKIIDGKEMLVKFKKPEYEKLLAIIKENAVKTGLNVEVSYIDKSSGAKTLLKSAAITFQEVTDLTVSLKNPFKAEPGEAISQNVSVTIENKGTAPAKNFDVQLVLSTDTDIPTAPAVFSESFKEDTLLEGARETIALLNPGDKKEFTFKGSLKIPADAPPGRYYLGVVADAGDKIKELDEKNNIDPRYLMLSLPEPKLVAIELPETIIVYNPATFGFTMECNGTPMSDGKDWRKCNIKTNIFQIKHAVWEKGLIWELNTSDGSLWQITGGTFCKKGGKAVELKMKVEAEGGSPKALPSLVTLTLTDVRLEYEPSNNKFRLTSNNNQLTYLPFWQIFKLTSHLYQIKHKLWTDFYWEVDAFKKKIRKVKGTQLGKKATTSDALDLIVNVDQ